LLRQAVWGWPHGLVHEDDDGIPTYSHHAWAWLPRIPYSNGHLWIRAGKRLFEQYVADYGKPDVIHAHSALFAGVLAARLQRYYNLPYVITEHRSTYMRGVIQFWESSLIKEAFAAAQARVVVSPQMGKVLETIYGETVHPWIWVPNMVDHNFQPPNHRESHAPFLVRFLSIGLMVTEKGQADLLRAFADCFKGDHGVQLRLGGDGPLRHNLERLALEYGVQQQVVFLGTLSRDQVLAEMQAASVFVLPSHYETFGLVLIEALACGKPVVATACGGPESIVHPGNGLLVPPRDPRALGGALVQMRLTFTTYDPESLRTDCLGRFGEQAVVARLDQVYRSVLRAWHGLGPGVERVHQALNTR